MATETAPTPPPNPVDNWMKIPISPGVYYAGAGAGYPTVDGSKNGVPLAGLPSVPVVPSVSTIPTIGRVSIPGVPSVQSLATTQTDLWESKYFTAEGKETTPEKAVIGPVETAKLLGKEPPPGAVPAGTPTPRTTETKIDSPPPTPLPTGITLLLSDSERQELATKQQQTTCQADAQKYEVKLYKVGVGGGESIFVEEINKTQAKEKAEGAGYKVTRVTWSPSYKGTDSAGQIVVEREESGSSIKLDSGEWVSKDAYDDLPNESQAQLNKLGVDGYNQWLVDEAGRQISTSGSQYLIDAFESGGLDGYNKAVDDYNKVIDDTQWFRLYGQYKQNSDKDWFKDNWDWFQDTYADKLNDKKYMSYLESSAFQDKYALVIQPSSMPVEDYNLIKPYIKPEGFDSMAAYRAGENNPNLAVDIIRATNEFTLSTLGDETRAKINSGEWTLLPYGQVIETKTLENMPPTYRNIVQYSGLVGYEAYQEKVLEWNKDEHWFKNTIDAIVAQSVGLGQDIKNFAILQFSATHPEVKEGDPKPVIDPFIPGAANAGVIGFTTPTINTYTTEEAAEINARRADAQKYYKDMYDAAEMAAQEWLAQRPQLQPVYTEGFVDTVKNDPSALKDPLLWTETMANTLPYTVATGLIAAGWMGGPAGLALGGSLAFGITLSVEGHDIYKDAIAHGASHDRALELANTYGAISAAIETLGDTIFVGALGVGGGAFSQALGKNLGRNIVTGAAKKYGWKNLTTGVVIDFVNQGGQEFFQEVVHNAAIKTVDQNQALLENTANAFVSGVIGTAPFVLIPAGGQAIRRLETKIGDVRKAKTGVLTPVDITPQMQIKILNKVFAPVSGFTVKTTEAEIGHFKKVVPEMLEKGPLGYVEGIWEEKGRNVYEAGKSITVGLIDKKTVIVDKAVSGEQVIPAAQRGRLAGSLEKQANGLQKIADGIIDEIGEINKKQNKTKADLDRKAKLDAKLKELETQISELRQAANDIDSGVVTPLVAQFYPKLAHKGKGKSRVDEVALAYAEMCAKVNEYALTQLKLKQALKAISDFGLAKSKSQLKKLNEYKQRSDELEAKLKELKIPMVKAVERFSDTFLKNSVGLEAEQKAEVRDMSKTIAMDIDSVTSQLFGDRTALEIAKDIKELEGQIKVIEDEISKGVARGQLEGYARLVAILRGQVEDMVNELRMRYLAEGEKIKSETKKLTMEVMSLQARLAKAVNDLNNFAGSSLNYDIYRKGELATKANVVRMERDTFEAVQRTTEAIWGRESYSTVLEQLNRTLSQIIDSMQSLQAKKRATKAAFKIYDAIKKQDVKLLKEGVKVLQLEAGKIKDKPLQLQAAQQVKLLETLTIENFWNRFKETKPHKKEDFTWYKSSEFESAQEDLIKRDAERNVALRLGRLMDKLPEYMRRWSPNQIMDYLRKTYDKQYFQDVHFGEFEDLDDFLDVDKEEHRIRQEIERQEGLQRRQLGLEIAERECTLAKNLRDKATKPKWRGILDENIQERERDINQRKADLKTATKTKLVIPAVRIVTEEETAKMKVAKTEERGLTTTKEEKKVSPEEKARAEAKAAQRIRIAKQQIMKEGERIDKREEQRESAFPGIRPKTAKDRQQEHQAIDTRLDDYLRTMTLAQALKQIEGETKESVFTGTAIQDATKAGIYAFTKAQTRSQTKTQTQTAVQTAVQTALKEQTKTATKEEIETATELITEIVTKTTTKTTTRRPPVVYPPRLKFEPIKGKQKKVREGPALASLKQGLFYISWYPPFRGNKTDVVYSRHRPHFAATAKGRHSPQKTLRVFGKVPPLMELPMGVVTARIKHGRKLTFSRQRKGKGKLAR